VVHRGDPVTRDRDVESAGLAAAGIDDLAALEEEVEPHGFDNNLSALG
jgi:hypothetical protein